MPNVRSEGDAQREKQSARGQHRSKQFVRAAVDLFYDSGYQNVTIDDIGAAVGLTGPAVYRHFKGKHDILVSALIGQVAGVHGMAQRAVSGDGDSSSRLSTYLTGLGERAVDLDEPMLWRRERRHLEAAESAQFRRIFSQILSWTADLVHENRPDLDRGQAEFLAYALLSMYANTRDIQGALPPNRVAQVLDGIARAIVSCAVPTQRVSGPPGAVISQRPPAGRRERLINAAAELFDARGFHGVRIDDIARAAGMSVATLYQHFGSKSDILEAILDRGAEGLLYITGEKIAHLATPEEVLETLVRTYVEQALGMHGRTLRILVTDALYLSTEKEEALRAKQQDYVGEWIAALAELRPELTTGEARAVAHAAIGVVTDMSQTGRVRNRPGIAAELHSLALAIVLDARTTSTL